MFKSIGCQQNDFFTKSSDILEIYTIVSHNFNLDGNNTDHLYYEYKQVVLQSL